MRLELQKLRDEMEEKSQTAANRGDRDTAEAWESIALRLDSLIRESRFDFKVIEERAWRT